MVIEILSYNSSILNPVLKLIVFAAFIIAAGLFYRCRQRYGGVLREISTLLCIGAIAGVLASAFRIWGDFYLQSKWGESLFDLFLVIVTLVIALIIRARIKDVTRRFESYDGDD